MSPGLPVAPYLKIRQYIVRILESSGQSEKIKSENELCQLFNVSRNTVRKALKEMVDEGYLITKPGVGTFINQYKSKLGRSGRKNSTFGLIYGNGRKIHYDNLYMQFCRGLYDIIGKNDISICLVSFLHEDERFIEELKALNLDGLIWLFPQQDQGKYFQKMCNILPCVFIRIDDSLPRTSVVSRNPEQMGKMTAEYFIKRKLTKVVFIKMPYDYSDRVLKSFLKEYRNRKIKHDPKLIISMDTNPVSSLKNMIEYEYPFQGIFSPPHCYNEVKNLMKTSHISVPILTEYTDSVSQGKVKSPCLFCDMMLAGKITGNKMLQLLNDKTSPVQTEQIDWTVI